MHLEFLDLAAQVAKKVGDEIYSQSNSTDNIQVGFKSRRDVVTNLDTWAENTIFQEIRKRFSNHVLVGEETSAILIANRNKTLQELISDGICWIVDPIDGTVNFANRFPYYCVSIGVTIKGFTEVGVVYDPTRKELFHAIKGKGAFLNGIKISASAKSDILDSVIATGRPADWKGNISENDVAKFEKGERILSSQARGIRKLGAAALDLCWVAASRLDACIQPCLKPWDVAAGSLIAQEAGARLGHFLEKDSSFSITNKSFICSTRKLYDSIAQTFAD